MRKAQPGRGRFFHSIRFDFEGDASENSDRTG